MKGFFKNLFGEFKSYDLLVILISSAVGAIFSLIPVIISYYDTDNFWTIFGIIVLFILFVFAFIVAIIVINYQQKKFSYIQMINDAYKKENWRAVYTFGEPLSTPLWRMSKLSLRMDVAEKVIKAIKNLQQKDENGQEINNVIINDIIFDAYEKLAKLHIDDLGYTTYILGNTNKSKNRIYEGFEYAEKISSPEKKLIIKLKGYRHLIAMCSNRDIVGDDALNIRNKFGEIYNEALLYSKDESRDKKVTSELLFAEYALIKYNYQTGAKDIDTVINEIKQLVQKLKEKKKSEWIEKCDQLIWEIELKNGTPKTNASNLANKISERSVFPNRFLKIVNLFLDYKIYQVKHYQFEPNRYGTNDPLIDLYEIKSEVKQLIKKVSKQIEESEDRASLASYNLKKKEFFNIVNRRIREAKRKWFVDKYNIILLDFDYTVFNYRKCQELALKTVLKENSLKYEKGYADIYRKINDNCWYNYKDSLDFSKIKAERVRLFLNEIQAPTKIDPNVFLERMEECMTRPVLMPGVKKFLKKCRGKDILVVTDARKTRCEKTLKNLKVNFAFRVFSSEDCSMLKSNKEYFKNAIDKIGKNINYSTILVIGDGIDTDIYGANEMGLDTCFIEIGYKLREDKVPHCINAKYSFNSFKDLNRKKIFK